MDSASFTRCSCCHTQLLEDKPRIVCNDCKRFASCSDCHLAGRVSGYHSRAHRFDIIPPGAGLPPPRGGPPAPLIPKGPLRCDCCLIELKPDIPRILCTDCKRFNSCANCHLMGARAGHHSPAHRFQIVAPSQDSANAAQAEQLRMLEAAREENARLAAEKAEAASQEASNEPPPYSATEEAGSASGYPQEKGVFKESKQKEKMASGPARWTWIGQLKPGQLYTKLYTDDNGGSRVLPAQFPKTSELTEKLIDAIFNYLDNMFEPYCTQMLTAEKYALSRCFWMPGKQKQEFIQKLYKTHDCRNYDEPVKDWTRLSDYITLSNPYVGTEVRFVYTRVTFADVKTYELETKEWKFTGARHARVQIASPKINREKFGRLWKHRMFAYPYESWLEACEALTAIPGVYKAELPEGLPDREYFPADFRRESRTELDLKAREYENLSSLIGFENVVGEMRQQSSIFVPAFPSESYKTGPAMHRN